MNGTYDELARDQQKTGQVILIASSCLAALLVLAGLVYAVGTGGRSAAAAAAAGCEPGMTSESAPCTTKQELAGQYTAVMTPASQQLSIDAAAYTAAAEHHLATAKAALTSEAATEQTLDAALAGIKFPPAVAPVAAALIRAEQARAKLTAEQAQASSLTALKAFNHRVQVADAAVQAEMKLMLKALDLTPAAA
jgi:hypothetical protein